MIKRSRCPALRARRFLRTASHNPTGVVQASGANIRMTARFRSHGAGPRRACPTLRGLPVKEVAIAPDRCAGLYQEARGHQAPAKGSFPRQARDGTTRLSARLCVICRKTMRLQHVTQVARNGAFVDRME